MKKYFLFFSFIASTAYLHSENPTVYSSIQSMNLSSLEWIDEEWPNESYRDYLIRCLDYQMHPPAAKKRRIVFKLLHKIASSSAQQVEQHNALFDLITAQDLQLFAGHKAGEAYLAGILSRTKTELGRVFFYGMLGCPTDNIALLENRQTIVKKLVSQEESFNQLDQAFERFADCENMLLSFWAQDGFVQSTKQQYFSVPFLKGLSDQLNTSEIALTVRSFANHQKRAFYLASSIFAAALLPLYGLSKLRNSRLPQPLQRLGRHLQGSGGVLLGMLSSARNKAIAGIAVIAAGMYCALSSKEDYEWAADNIVLDSCIQKKMMAIASFFDTLTALKKHLDSFPGCLDEFPAAQTICEFFEDTLKNHAQLLHLIDVLRTPSFKGEPSFFRNQGRILLAFRLFYQVKEKLEPVLLALAEIDAHLSIARLYKEYQNERVHFCFVEYKKEPPVTVLMKHFWNPFIDKNVVVANDLALQGPDQRNMVITGPNAGGKSTLIKAIAINLILAQSLCIAACDSLVLTPFYAIGTYLNVVDNLAVGNSLFKAQVLRAQQMVDLVEKTPPNSLSFIALDEMFNGTSAKESKVIAYSVAKHIGSFTNNICVLATHFPLLTKLAQPDNDGPFANYKVSVEVSGNVDQQGIYYPFKLEKGVSNQHIALDILKEEGYACSIVEEALALLKQLASSAKSSAK